MLKRHRELGRRQHAVDRLASLATVDAPVRMIGWCEDRTTRCRRGSCRSRSPHRHVPGLPPAGGVAREVAVTKRAAFRDEEYSGRPVPGFGDPSARLVVVGLAPAAHGANRTGRMFTGDRSGDFLYAAMHRAGFASQPTSNSPRRRAGAARCLGDRPGGQVRAARQQADRPGARQLPAVPGGRARCPALARDGGARWVRVRGRGIVAGDPTTAPFRSRGRVPLEGGRTLLGCFHVSQQNTFTGRLTPAMLDDVFERARMLIEA